MRKILVLTSFLFALFAFDIQAKHRINYSIDVNIFFSQLEPYGEWIEIGYDDYVWRPYKSDYNWKPYSEGRWEWTKYGWYWVSYEPFGWATYHYGRWYYDDYYGWVWMPDNVWAPAWVEWRYNDVYVGWAPLPPYAKFSHRSGIYFSITWKSDYYYWNFVRYNHFISHKIHNHFVHHNHMKKIFRTTKRRTNYFLDNNRIVNGGISRKYVERKIGKKLTTRSIRRTDRYNIYEKSNKRGNNKIYDYKPRVRKSSSITFDKSKIKRGEKAISLSKEKVVIKRNKKNSYNSERVETKKETVKRLKRNKNISKRNNYNSSSDSWKKKSDVKKNKKYEKKNKRNIESKKQRIEKRSEIKKEKRKSESKKSSNSKREVRKRKK